MVIITNYAAFLSMRQAVEHWLNMEPIRHDKPLFLAGHSMGGALATVCARYLAELPQYREPEKLCLVTFGSPCVGNEEFAASIERKVV
jgi:triacylglycerol lipase